MDFYFPHSVIDGFDCKGHGCFGVPSLKGHILGTKNPLSIVFFALSVLNGFSARLNFIIPVKGANEVAGLKSVSYHHSMLN